MLNSSKILGADERGAALDAERQAASALELSHTEVWLELYTGKIFLKQELADSEHGHVAIRHMLNPL